TYRATDRHAVGPRADEDDPYAHAPGSTGTAPARAWPVSPLAFVPSAASWTSRARAPPSSAVPRTLAGTDVAAAGCRTSSTADHHPPFPDTEGVPACLSPLALRLLSPQGLRKAVP